MEAGKDRRWEGEKVGRWVGGWEGGEDAEVGNSRQRAKRKAEIKIIEIYYRSDKLNL